MFSKIVSLVKIVVPFIIFLVAFNALRSIATIEVSAILAFVALTLYLGAFWYIVGAIERGIGWRESIYLIGQHLINVSGLDSDDQRGLTEYEVVELIYNYGLRFKRHDDQRKATYYQYKNTGYELLAVDPAGVHYMYKRNGQVVWSKATSDLAKIEHKLNSQTADLESMLLSIEANKPKQPANNGGQNNGNQQGKKNNGGQNNGHNNGGQKQQQATQP